MKEINFYSLQQKIFLLISDINTQKIKDMILYQHDSLKQEVGNGEFNLLNLLSTAHFANAQFANVHFGNIHSNVHFANVPFANAQFANVHFGNVLFTNIPFTNVHLPKLLRVI